MNENPSIKDRPPLLTAQTPHTRVLYPPLLEEVSSDGMEGIDLALAWRQKGLPFRPSIVFTSNPATASLIDASAAAVLAAQTQHPGAQILGVETFSLRGSDAPMGRVVTFTYPADELLDVMVRKWVVATGDHHLHVSASFLPSQASVVAPIVELVVSYLEIAANPEQIYAASGAPSQIGVLIDREATERAGVPMEDLSAIPLSGPQRARPVPVAAVARLKRAWGVGDATPEKLFIATGRGTDQGFYLTYPGRHGVLVVRSSGSSAVDFDAQNVQVYGLAEEQVLADAAAWVGIRPLWSKEGHRTLPFREYQARVAGRWVGTAWTELRFRLPTEHITAIWAPGEGYFQATSLDEQAIQLRPFLPLDMLSLIGEALY